MATFLEAVYCFKISENKDSVVQFNLSVKSTLYQELLSPSGEIDCGSVCEIWLTSISFEYSCHKRFHANAQYS